MSRAGVGARSVALFLLALLLVMPPVLSIFSAEALLFGVPLLFVYLFVAWGGIILLIATTAVAGRARRDAEGDAWGAGALARRD